MNDFVLPSLASGKLYLITAPRSIGKPIINEFIARLALASPIVVLDGGGSSIDPLFIARELRRQARDYLPILERVRIARAFTCHELATLLESQALGPEPLVLLDFLALLDDENLREVEREAIFERLTRRLLVLRSNAPVLVSIQAAVLPHTQELALCLEKLSDQALSFPPTASYSQQLGLF